jgi:hypothetical protein
VADDALAKVVRPTEDLLTRSVGDDLVLLELGSEQYYALDEVGAAMWEAILASPSLQAARDQLLDRFDVPADELTSDLLELVDHLRSIGLVTEAPA